MIAKHKTQIAKMMNHNSQLKDANLFANLKQKNNNLPDNGFSKKPWRLAISSELEMFEVIHCKGTSKSVR